MRQSLSDRFFLFVIPKQQLLKGDRYLTHWLPFSSG